MPDSRVYVKIQAHPIRWSGKAFLRKAVCTCGRRRKQSIAPARIDPAAPCRKSPGMAFTALATVWVPTRTTAKPQPQNRRRNQPRAAITRTAPSTRKATPPPLPKGVSRWYAGAFNAHRRSRKGLRQISCRQTAKPAIAAPNNRKMPNALKPRNEFVCASLSNQQGTLEQKPSQLRRGRFSHIRHKDRCCEDGRRRRCPWNARR